MPTSIINDRMRGLGSAGVQNRGIDVASRGVLSQPGLIAQASGPLPIEQGQNYSSNRVTSALLIAGFGINQVTLSAEHRAALDQFVAMLESALFYRIIRIEGRASDTGPEQPQNVRPGGQGPGNQALSDLRAQAVGDYIASIQTVNVSQPPAVEGYGSSEPLVEGTGEIAVNRSVLVVFEIEARVPDVPLPDLYPPSPIVSRSWEIGIDFTATAAAAVMGMYGTGKLRNSVTGEEYDIKFQSFGIGIGFNLAPSPSLSSISYEPFETHSPVPAVEFHERYCRVSEGSINAYIVGYGVTIINMPQLATGEIRIYSPGVGRTNLKVGFSIASGFFGILELERESLDRARRKLREYNEEARAFNAEQRRRRGE